MSAVPTWLYSLVHFSGASLAAVIYLAGLVVSVRRWHRGVAARLGAVGFGLLAVNAVAVQSATMGLWLLGLDEGGTFPWSIVLGCVSALLIAVGHVLLVLALRAALGGDVRGWEAPSEDRDDGWSAFADEDEPG